MLVWIARDALARQGQRLTPWAGVLALSVAFNLLPAFLPLSEWFTGAVLAELAIPFGATILLIALWVGLYERRPFSSLGFERAAALVRYGRGLLIGLLAFAGVVGLLALFGVVTFEAAPAALVGTSALPTIFLILPGWVVQGASEEIATRGWMLPVIGARYRPLLGILSSTLFFTIMHAFNPGLSALAIINLTLYGLFAAFYALREGSLWGICAFHSIWNWAQGHVFGLSVSGLSLTTGTLLDLATRGPDVLTGGAFGPEGSLATTAVFGLGIAILLLFPMAKGKCSTGST